MVLMSSGEVCVLCVVCCVFCHSSSMGSQALRRALFSRVVRPPSDCVLCCVACLRGRSHHRLCVDGVLRPPVRPSAAGRQGCHQPRHQGVCMWCVLPVRGCRCCCCCCYRCRRRCCCCCCCCCCCRALVDGRTPSLPGWVFVLKRSSPLPAVVMCVMVRCGCVCWVCVAVCGHRRASGGGRCGHPGGYGELRGGDRGQDVPWYAGLPCSLGTCALPMPVRVCAL